MAESSPQFRIRRQAVINLYNSLTPAEQATFDLLDWYWLNGPGAGAPPQSRPAAPVTDHLGIEVETMHTLHWKTRATADLAHLDDMAISTGFWNLEGPVRDAHKWELLITWFEELVAA